MSTTTGSATPGPDDQDPVDPPASGTRPSNRVLLGLGGAAIALAAIVVVLVVNGGSGDDDLSSGTVTVARPTTTLADCPAEPVEAPGEWPLALPSQVVVTGYTVSGNTFLAEGLTNDAETVLVRSMEQTLAGYDVDEPSGGASDVVVGFRSEAAEGVVTLSDADGDSCWDTSYELTFFTEPDASQLQPIEPSDGVDGGSGGSDEASGLVEPVGGGTATTGRGSFPLTVTMCTLDPVNVEASAESGSLVVTGDPGGSVTLRWVYDDGVVVEDTSARSIISSATDALFIADGTNDEGPEAILAEISCFS